MKKKDFGYWLVISGVILIIASLISAIIFLSLFKSLAFLIYISLILEIIGLTSVTIGGLTKEVKEKDNSENKMKSKK
ncbi:MAG: hypothetical protein ACTSUX_05935 [Promethearchaeota archaeon]